MRAHKGMRQRKNRLKGLLDRLADRPLPGSEHHLVKEFSSHFSFFVRDVLRCSGGQGTSAIWSKLKEPGSERQWGATTATWRWT
jgi:hypothetical protein